MRNLKTSYDFCIDGSTNAPQISSWNLIESLLNQLVLPRISSCSLEKAAASFWWSTLARSEFWFQGKVSQREFSRTLADKLHTFQLKIRHFNFLKTRYSMIRTHFWKEKIRRFVLTSSELSETNSILVIGTRIFELNNSNKRPIKNKNEKSTEINNKVVNLIRDGFDLLIVQKVTKVIRQHNFSQILWPLSFITPKIDY